MKPGTVLSLLAAAGLLACAGDVPAPRALVDARADYARAKGGVTLQLDPTDVHEADLALQKAELAWSDSHDPNDEHAIDLAIIAQRKAQIAMAEAAAQKAQQDAQQAKSDLSTTVQAQLQATRGQLNKTQENLAQTQTALQQTAAQAAEQKK